MFSVVLRFRFSAWQMLRTHTLQSIRRLHPPPQHTHPKGGLPSQIIFFIFFFFLFLVYTRPLIYPIFVFCLSLSLCCCTPVTTLCISSRICSFPLRLSQFYPFSVYLLALCLICPYSLFSVPPPCPTTMSHIPCWGVGQGRTG